MIAGQRQFRRFEGASECHYPHSEWIPPHNPKYPYGRFEYIVTHRGKSWWHIIDYHNETGKSTGYYYPIVDTCENDDGIPF